MREYIAGPDQRPPLGRRGRGELLGSVGRALLVGAAVILAVGGLVVVGFTVVLVVGLNSWASNK